MSTIETFPLPTRPTLKVFRDSPMSLHTTWRIGGTADFLIRVPTKDDLLAAVEWANSEGMPITVIGGGSNLLAPDAGIRGVVLLSRTPGERAENLLSWEDLGDAVRVEVGAQAPLSWVGRFAAEHGWAGMDWGVGLPGTIGGATVNNAGAHGTEQKDHLESVTVRHDDGSIVTHPREWLEPAYRHTLVKASPRPRPYIVIGVSLLLPKADKHELVQLADEHAAYRKETQPTGACAGSTFANPPGDFAGRLLEASGMKGFNVGPVAYSTKHSNFIVNSGGGTAAQVRELIATGKSEVRERFGVELMTEIEDLGEPV
jgi:UDP-N-acetylmuramate dehydrogenase